VLVVEDAVLAIRILVVAVAIAWASPALAQSSCSGIVDPAARLRCYDGARAAAEPRSAYASPAGACTRASPCVGPRGGVYHITPSGYRHYLPRR